ncbi:MAG: NHLP family bacteriocin export ABC transporter peptidase/permease/ATPase subunit [Rhodospirillaceae bacterium]|nr:NHLP family bacteriocin export ABC transporter peptidase/permease/ATPase subunit [Rhodospirillales bacterium]
MDALECGAACLSMVLAYHGRWVPLETLRQACGVSRDGSKASNVLKVARTFGLAAKGFRKEPEGLTDLPVPSIIHWNFNHYVVFEGIHKGRAFLNDPAHGPLSVTLDELSESFTGVVLAFTRTEAFQPGGNPPNGLRQLFRHLGHSHRPLALTGAFSMLLVVPGVVIPGLEKLFVDQVLVQQFETWVVPLCLGLVLCALVQAGLTAIQQGLLARLEAKLSVTLSARYLSRLMALPQNYFNQRHSGDLSNRAAAADRVAELLSGQLATNIFNMAAVAFYGLAMAAYDPVLAAIALGLAVGNVAVLRLVQRQRTDLNRGLTGDLGRLSGATVSAIAGIETLKVTGGEDHAFAGWSGVQAQALATQQRLGLLDALLNGAPTLLAALSAAAILGIGGWRVIDGALTVGSLVALQALMTSITGPVAGLVGLAGRFQAAKGDLERLADVLDQPATQDAATEEGMPARLAGAVELVDVSFGYNPCEPPLVQNFSLSLKPGARVALVGGSGSGKSTIGRMVCGLQVPWSGQVLIDGRPLETIPPHVFAGSVAYVDQDVFLFEGTARDNLTLWDATFPETALTQALKDAAIHAEVASRPGQYDTAIAEGGTNFSGGQRQRLEIARALVSDPSVLVLDEATAALDPVTEKAIDDNIRRRGCTCLIIAHRLSTIRDCDEIVVLDQGRVIERGIHDQLMDAGGAYADLIRAGR